MPECLHCLMTAQHDVLGNLLVQFKFLEEWYDCASLSIISCLIVRTVRSGDQLDVLQGLGVASAP